MRVGHKESQASTSIYTLGDNDEAHIGRVGFDEADDAATVEERWNRFAQEMWRAGLEPVDDEPWFTTVSDGVTWDHYVLREVRND